jgi:hypothetical protein
VRFILRPCSRISALNVTSRDVILSRDMTTPCPRFDLDWFFDVIGWSEPTTLWAGFVRSNPLKGCWTDRGVILSERLFWYARWSRNTVFDIYICEFNLDFGFLWILS